MKPSVDDLSVGLRQITTETIFGSHDCLHPVRLLSDSLDPPEDTEQNKEGVHG